MTHTFKKIERLNSKKQIELLFTEGESFFKYPFKVIYLTENNIKPDVPKLLISVSRKNFKKAVDRNKIKRIIREAYRKNKEPLITTLREKDIVLVFAIIYTAKTILSYAEIEKKIILILQRLIEQDEQAVG